MSTKAVVESDLISRLIKKLKKFNFKKLKNFIFGMKERNRIRKRIEFIESNSDFKLGSADWLAACELNMGGYVSSVPRKAFSSLDPRSKAEIEMGGMIGGDRMIHHNYGDAYEKHLSRFIGQKSDYVIVECGILKGTGLAVWSSLFPQSMIIGLDIYLGHTKTNLENLKERGAFKFSDPILLTFDQFSPKVSELSSVLGDRKIDIVIDDGFHSIETIMNTFDSLEGFLAPSFVYFVEDNTEVVDNLRQEYSKYQIDSYGQLTVVSSQEI